MIPFWYITWWLLLLSDCDNCGDCRNNKCHKCNEGYALRKIYARRLCVLKRECWGGEKDGVVWDPVLGTHVCDRRRECEASSKCIKCLVSGSCTKCKENFALKLRYKEHIGFNECTETCVCGKCVEPKSQAQICKSSTAFCASPATHPPTLVTTVSSTVSSIQTTSDMNPSAVGTSTGNNEESKPTEEWKMKLWMTIIETSVQPDLRTRSYKQL